MGIFYRNAFGKCKDYCNLKNKEKSVNLVELLNEDFSPKYIFLEDLNLIRKPAPEEVGLNFTTYRNDVDEQEARDLALETFGKNCSEKLLWSKSCKKTFESKLREEKYLCEKEVRDWSFSNFYFKDWKGNKGLTKALVFLGTGFAPSLLHMYGMDSLAIGGFAFHLAGIEFFLRQEFQKEYKKDFENIGSISESYNYFEDKVKTLDVSINAPEKAQEIFEMVKDESSKVNIDSVNLGLMGAYFIGK